MKNGIVSLLLLGIVAVLLLLGIFIFGPWELPGLGQLSQRQIDQAISAATVPTIPPGDSDSDGFSDEVEKWIKTDPSDNCADDVNDAAWPPDFNNDKMVNDADLGMLKVQFGSRVKGENNRRYDLNADKTINLSDVFLFSNFSNKGCPYQFMSNPRFEGPNVIFTWTPATEVPVLLRAIDLTKSGHVDCNSVQSYQSSAFTTTIGIGSRSWGWSQPEPGHSYCAALLAQSTDSYLVSNFMEFSIPVKKPDFVITSLTTDKRIYYPGGTVNVSITIQNQSESSANGSFMTIYRLGNFTSCRPEGFQGQFDSGPIGPGEIKTFRGKFTLTDVGAVSTINAMVDAYCQVDELDENNNRRSTDFVIATSTPTPSFYPTPLQSPTIQ